MLASPVWDIFSRSDDVKLFIWTSANGYDTAIAAAAENPKQPNTNLGEQLLLSTGYFCRLRTHTSFGPLLPLNVHSVEIPSDESETNLDTFLQT